MTNPPRALWSKVVLVAASFLTAYSLLALRSIQLHHQVSGSPGAQEFYHCPIFQLALLACVTGITGIVAGFRETRCAACSYIVLLLVLELTALGVLSHIGMRAYDRCLVTSQKLQVETNVVEYKAAGVRIIVEENTMSGVTTDTALLNNCNTHVHKAMVLAACILGVIVLALVHCGIRLMHAVTPTTPEDGEEEHLVIISSKADPLEESCSDETTVFVKRF